MIFAGCSSASPGDDGDSSEGHGESALEGSTGRQVPIHTRRPGVCPASVHIGIRGESFAEGVAYTADIKSLIRPGANLVLDRKEPTTLRFSAPLATTYASCVGASDRETFFDTRSNYQVRFNGKDVTVTVEVSPSLGLESSLFNNQAIFKVREKL